VSKFLRHGIFITNILGSCFCLKVFKFIFIIFPRLWEDCKIYGVVLKLFLNFTHFGVVVSLFVKSFEKIRDFAAVCFSIF